MTAIASPRELSDVALLLTGAPGAGKSSTLGALGTRLETAEIAYGSIECDWFGWGWPWLSGSALLPSLRALLAAQRAAGRRRFIVTATTETDAELVACRDTLGAARTLVVLLSVAPETAAARVAAREPDAWPGKPGLVTHARELAASMETLHGIDLRVAGDGRPFEEVAADVHAALEEHGLV